ncbi:hypothetical protein ACFQ14_05360 [Pseudahrensia aquimaris]|uniref:Uncharacterized protein n=1 Tax=Pseudahrensia aquimaris TaxID=744461 RepID=A0ABW3FEF3_9HYPH
MSECEFISAVTAVMAIVATAIAVIIAIGTIVRAVTCTAIATAFGIATVVHGTRTAGATHTAIAAVITRPAA